MNILFIGDVFGELGVRAIEKELNTIKRKYNVDLTIANVENVTNCRGLSKDHYQHLRLMGIDFFTMGNHTWKQSDFETVLKNSDIIRPYNIDYNSPLSKIGVGTQVIKCNNKHIRITNILGKSVHLKQVDIENPFVALDEIVDIANEDIHIVDFHAETTSEKNFAIWAFKSRVSAIIGTHTHVQTNDARIINNTFYITDVGMTGPADGIIGARPESIEDMFYDRKEFFKLEEAKGSYQFCAILVHFDDITNLPTSFEKIYIA